MTAREHHEKVHHQKEALMMMRQGCVLTKMEWNDRFPGTRIAPAIDCLRNAWGFRIGGDGSLENPHFMLDRKQLPAKRAVTDHMKQSYYATTHWTEVRRTRLRYDNFCCVVCKADEALRVHHLVYNLFAESVLDLITVCDSCHQKIHDNSKIKFPSGMTSEQVEMLGIDLPWPQWVLP